MATQADQRLAAPNRLVLPAALAPGLTVVALLCIYPLGLALVTSLEGKDGPTLARYLGFFADRRSYGALLNTIGLAAMTTVASICVSIPLGYVARSSPRLGTAIRALVALPLAVPVLIAGYALTLFFSTNGLFNNILVRVLFILSDPLTISYTWGGLVVACVWRFFPYTALLLMSALAALDRDLENAAASIGANPWQTFWRVTVPLLAPAAVTGGVLTFVSTFGTFSIPLIMGGSGDVLSVMAYRKIAGSFDWPSAATIVAVMAVIQICTLVALRSAVARWTHQR